MNTLLSSTRSLRILLIMCSLSTLLSCGGGGGGGGTSSSGANNGIRVLHAAIDGDPVQLRLDGLTQTDLLRFSGLAPFYKLTTAPHLIEVTSANGGGAIHAFELAPLAQERYSLLLTGSLSAGGLSFHLINETVPPLSPGNGAVRVVHGLFGANQIRGSIGAATLAPLTLGSASEFSEIAAGPVNVELSRVSDSKVVASQLIEVTAGKSSTIFLAGDADYFGVTRILE